MNKIIATTILLLMTASLSACSGAIYNSNFTCPNAKGFTCHMLNAVDKKIDSGEIEKIYPENQCNNNNCEEKTPEINNKKTYKLELIEGENLYVENNDSKTKE